MDLAFCETEGGRNRHEEQRQEPYSKGSILTAVESRLPYGLNIVNSYFATFNKDSVDFLNAGWWSIRVFFGPFPGIVGGGSKFSSIEKRSLARPYGCG